MQLCTLHLYQVSSSQGTEYRGQVPSEWPTSSRFTFHNLTILVLWFQVWVRVTFDPWFLFLDDNELVITKVPAILNSSSVPSSQMTSPFFFLMSRRHSISLIISSVIFISQESRVGFEGRCSKPGHNSERRNVTGVWRTQPHHRYQGGPSGSLP